MVLERKENDFDLIGSHLGAAMNRPLVISPGCVSFVGLYERELFDYVILNNSFSKPTAIQGLHNPIYEEET